jgi:hypothetical protein
MSSTPSTGSSSLISSSSVGVIPVKYWYKDVSVRHAREGYISFKRVRELNVKPIRRNNYA